MIFLKKNITARISETVLKYGSSPVQGSCSAPAAYTVPRSRQCYSFLTFMEQNTSPKNIKHKNKKISREMEKKSVLKIVKEPICSRKAYFALFCKIYTSI